jgi:isochorismate pyruvate lyase
MEEVRASIDDVDSRLVALMAERVGYIDRAAEIKATLGLPARVDWRVEEVVGRVRAAAAAAGLDADLAEGLWRRIIDWSIAREERALGRRD